VAAVAAAAAAEEAKPGGDRGGLLPMFLGPTTGRFESAKTVTLGARGAVIHSKVSLLTALLFSKIKGVPLNCVP
jgi:hypothetical protein